MSRGEDYKWIYKAESGDRPDKEYVIKTRLHALLNYYRTLHMIDEAEDGVKIIILSYPVMRSSLSELAQEKGITEHAYLNKLSDKEELEKFIDYILKKLNQ